MDTARHLFHLTALSLLLSLPCLFFPCRSLADQPLVIGSIFSPPLSCPDLSGALDRVVTEAFRRIGREVEIIPLPGERSLQNANLGLIDGDILRIGGMETLYPNLVPVPEKIMDFQFVAFTRLQDAEVGGWPSLAPYATAIVTGWKILEHNVPAEERVDVLNEKVLFTLLKKERAEIVVHEFHEGLFQARLLGIDDVRVLSPPLAVREMFLYLHNRHGKLAVLLADAVRGMKRDGAYAAIMQESLGPQPLCEGQ